VIRYTINGDEPDEHSPIYSEPLRISSDAIIKARVFRDGFKPSSYQTGSLAFFDPDRNGLEYHYYEGKWERIPDFFSLESVREGIIYEPGLDMIPFKADRFGLVLQGMIEIPDAALYTFYLSSNDGSKLFIDGELIIDNDGLHGAIEKQGQVKLSRGKHALWITYFQAGGGYHLKAYISGPDSEKVSIPPSMLFFKKNKPRKHP